MKTMNKRTASKLINAYILKGSWEMAESRRPSRKVADSLRIYFCIDDIRSNVTDDGERLLDGVSDKMIGNILTKKFYMRKRLMMGRDGLRRMYYFF